jgi:hypothetical protein
MEQDITAVGFWTTMLSCISAYAWSPTSELMSDDNAAIKEQWRLMIPSND